MKGRAGTQMVAVGGMAWAAMWLALAIWKLSVIHTPPISTYMTNPNSEWIDAINLENRDRVAHVRRVTEAVK